VPYLLDTNIISDIMRNPRGLAAQRARVVGPSNIRTSILVISEVRYGLAKRHAPVMASRLAELEQRVPILPFDAPADEHYVVVRTQLEKQGTPIGALDLLIAAHALALDDTLVTANEREFSRVEGLRVENWLR
jgi:tRNA(fMet)-specific endonuclease VapC